MADDVAITVDHVSKEFKLPHEKQTSIKNSLISVFKGGKRSFERQQVLKDISFEIKKGEFFGIVGRNGSGKSTLLKMLAGIYVPTKGGIQVNGKLTPFIELGVGFNPELTGRENVFLNGALLGFNRRDMEAMYDDIVSFAELGKFMDQKLKNYSSGMQVRLAFSIAIRAKSDVLVLDEVLAVGDEAFQQKCIDVFERYKSNHQTIVLVTHDMGMVRRFCTRAVLIQGGEVLVEGDPNKVASKYSQLNNELIAQEIDYANIRQGDHDLKISLGKDSAKVDALYDTGSEAKIVFTWPEHFEGVKNIGFAIMKNSGEFMFGANTIGMHPDLSKRRLQVTVRLDLGPGKYHLVAGLFGETEHHVVTFNDRGPQLMIREQADIREQGMVRLDHEWAA